MMRNYLFFLGLLWPLLSSAQTQTVSIQHVNDWVRPTAAVGFSGKEGGRFSLTESPQLQQRNFVAKQQRFKVFPNPNNGLFQIEAKVLPQLISVYNAQGQLVGKVQPQVKGPSLAEVQLVNLSAGMYFLHAQGFLPQRVQVN